MPLSCVHVGPFRVIIYEFIGINKRGNFSWKCPMNSQSMRIFTAVFWKFDNRFIYNVWYLITTSSLSFIFFDFLQFIYDQWNRIYGHTFELCNFLITCIYLCRTESLWICLFILKQFKFIRKNIILLNYTEKKIVLHIFLKPNN